MASRKTLDRRRAVLRARGVPEKFVEAIARRHGPFVFAALLFLQLVVSIAIAFAVTTVFGQAINRFLAPWLYGAPAASLLVIGANIAQELNAAGVMVAVALVLAQLSAFNGPARRSPAADRLALRLRAGDPATVKHNPDYGLCGILSGMTDDRAFLDVVRSFGRKTARPPFWMMWLFLSGVGLVNVANTLSDYTVVRTDAIEVHHWGRVQLYLLADTDHAEVTCRGEGGFEYRLMSKGGKMVSLLAHDDDVHGYSAAQAAERLSVIDARLSALHVRIDRVPPAGSPADEAGRCVARKAAYWPAADRAVLRRLVFGN